MLLSDNSGGTKTVVELIATARGREAWKHVVERSAVVPPRPDG